MSDHARSVRLLYLIIVKLMIELLLLAGTASYAAWFTFHPLLHGVIDIASGEEVAGWAFNSAAPEGPVEVQLFVDGRFFASQLADAPRPDLVKAGVTKLPGHGYRFPLVPGVLSKGEHRAEVFAVLPAVNGYRTLIPLSGTPLSFTMRQ